MRIAVEIALSEDEVAHLNKLSKSRSVSVRLAERSQIILLAGAGMTNEEIGDELGITRQKAGRWRVRYAESGIDGISQDASRPGRKPKIGSRKVAKVIKFTTQTTREKCNALEPTSDGREDRHQHVIGGPDMEKSRFEATPGEYVQAIKR